MLGIPSFVASGVSGFFYFIGLAFVFMISIYAIYRYFENRNSQQQQSDFVDIENQRQQTVETVRDYAVETTADLQEQATQILTGIQTGQEHLETLIEEFNRGLEDIQSNQANLSTNNQDLQRKVISPFQTLLIKMQTEFNSICEQIKNFSAVYTTANKAVVEREKELSDIIGNLKTADKSLGSLNSIKQTMMAKEKKIRGLQEQNGHLTKKMNELIKQIAQYEQVIQQQQTLIDLLQPAGQQLNAQSNPSTEVENNIYGVN